ncbi:MAG TPA: hypothetical protein VHS31_03835 [Tepidisphaeraceae bacterium]|nr:hypothetical protein [Tepidisphaeraceae bacterium]
MRDISVGRLNIALLLIGAFCLRLGWVLYLPVDESALRTLPDQVEYLQLGRNLLENHELQFTDPRFNQTVYAYRTPGYPVMVALCGANLRVIRLLQALLDTSTILAVYLLARRWLSPFACAIAALVIAINPFLIYFTGLILSETLFISMLAWGMMLLSRQSWRAAIPGVLILALSILVRPSAMLLPIFLTITNPRRVMFAVLMFFVVLFPWAARNHAILGKWVWTTTNAGITQYDGFNPQADGSSNQNFVDAMPELQKMNEVERSDYLSHLAREFAAQNPFIAIKLAIQKIARTWTPIPLSDEYRTQPLIVLIAACYSIPFDLLVLYGLARSRLPRAAKVYLLIPAIYFTAAHAISVGSLRYRIPAEVPMGVLVVSCMSSVVDKKTTANLH